ncbi:MAG: hypothetical protein GF330_04410 [Candidatus Eisenbacteria bacterium]|nr:hypothetical protein [Candidatus Eisenbacteria bacterium]
MEPHESQMQHPTGAQEEAGATASTTPPPRPETAPPPPPRGAPSYGKPPGGYASAPQVRRKSAVLAGILSLMPGLGQVYVGHYQRGFLHVLIIASTITLLSAGAGDSDTIGPLFGFFLSFYWLYNIVDAVRLANAYNDIAAGATPEERAELARARQGGSIFGGIVLVVFGILVLLNTVLGVSMAWLQDWWPIAPIAVGVYLIYKGIQDRQKTAA